MLYHLLYPLSQNFFAFNIFRYITFRSMIAFLIGTAISIIWGRYFIDYMKKKQFGELIREVGPQTHKKKAGTPTMGGVFILGSLFLTLLICGNFNSIPFILTFFVGISFFLLGFKDDYTKRVKKNKDGVSAKEKLIWQTLTALVIGFVIVKYNVVNTTVYFPFNKNVSFDLGWGYAIFAAIVIIGSSNAVNLTDGLDGLAIGPIMVSAMTMAVFTYVAGHKELAAYLYIPHIEGVGELAVMASAIIGAGIGFLWYNSYPAQIFMGDVGSLSLGGILGTMAVMSKNELLFVVIGGVFVAEALSVIIQVSYFKYTKRKFGEGRRIFKMTPLHHHFELTGWPEPKVIVRFWIVSIVLSLIALSTLKMR